jgi:hypothetical protein
MPHIGRVPRISPPNLILTLGKCGHLVAICAHDLMELCAQIA